MLTPLDIQDKEFRKTLMGYDSKSVDLFLDEIIGDFENVYKENIELKDKIKLFSDQIRHYNALEETLKDTLIIAQTTSEEVVSAARAKSQNITDEAEMNADKIIELAKERVRDIKEEYEYLRKEMFSFRVSHQSFIEAQLISLNKFHKEIEDKDVSNKLIKEEKVDKNIYEEVNEEELHHNNENKEFDDLGA